MAAMNYRQTCDTVLWRARRGRPDTARKLTLYQVDRELAEVAAAALARSPAAARAGSTALETLSRACRAIAEREVRHCDAENVGKLGGLARAAAWSIYRDNFTRRITAEFDRLDVSRMKNLTTTIKHLGARL